MSKNNITDEKILEEMEQDEKLQRSQQLADLKKILDTEEGLRFYVDLFDKSYLLKSTFTGNSTGFFLEGHRNLSLVTLSDICRISPEKVGEIMIRLLKKYNEEEDRENGRK